MGIEPEISGLKIVVLGEFNPAMFSPAWFAHNGLLRERVATSAQVQIVHSQVTDFTADWLHLQVTKDRFAAETKYAPHDRVWNLVLQVFSDHLHHTPLTAFGINRSVHFLVRDAATRDLIGRALAPLEPWGRWRDELDLDGRHGGMTSVRMSQLRPDGRQPGGQINVTVQPSDVVGQGGRGVYVSVNDHFVTNGTGIGSAERLMEILRSEFVASSKRSEEIVDHIMSLSEG